MNPERVINNTFWIMVLLRSIDAIDMPGSGGLRKLPAPRTYVVLVVLWGLFSFTERTSFARLAADLALLTTVATLVLGPGGRLLTGFFNTIASNFSQPSSAPSGPVTVPIRPRNLNV